MWAILTQLCNYFAALWSTRLSYRVSSPTTAISPQGFKIIPADEKLEEEKWDFYKPELSYPVRIEEIFQSRYQVLGKLGYGAHSTVWMCRDMT